MTTFAMLPAAIRRLFDRVDTQASSSPLRVALEAWRHRRGSGVYPAAGDILKTDVDSASSYLFMVGIGENAHLRGQFQSVGDFAAVILKPETGTCLLEQCGNRKAAVMLRRLFALVSKGGEPLTVQFTITDADDHHTYEALAAPLSSAGSSVDGIFGGIVKMT